MAGLESFDEGALFAFLDETPVPAKGMAKAAEPDLLRIAKDYNSTPFPGFPRGRYNQSPGDAGWDGAGGVYTHDDHNNEFRNTLELEVDGDDLLFRSPAVRVRKGSVYPYGEAIIHGGGDNGPYRLLPIEFYT